MFRVSCYLLPFGDESRIHQLLLDAIVVHLARDALVDVEHVIHVATAAPNDQVTSAHIHIHFETKKNQSIKRLHPHLFCQLIWCTGHCDSVLRLPSCGSFTSVPTRTTHIKIKHIHTHIHICVM